MIGRVKRSFLLVEVLVRNFPHRHSFSVCLVTALFAAPGFGSPVAYDGFGNAPLATLDGSTGGTGWGGAWQDINSSQITSVVGPGLECPGLTVQPGAATTPSGGSFDAADYYRPLAPYTSPSGTLYMSFVLRPDPGYGSYAGLRFGVWPRAVWVGVPLGYYSYGMTIGDGFVIDSGIPITPGHADLLVLEVRVTPSMTSYRLFVDPDLRRPQPATADAEWTFGGAIPLPTALELINDGGYTTDEIRVGTEWSDAAPPACIGDFTNDRRVTTSDLTVLLGSFGHGVPAFTQGDLDGDAGVTTIDLTILLARFGASCP